LNFGDETTWNEASCEMDSFLGYFMVLYR